MHPTPDTITSGDIGDSKDRPDNDREWDQRAWPVLTVATAESIQALAQTVCQPS